MSLNQLQTKSITEANAALERVLTILRPKRKSVNYSPESEEILLSNLKNDFQFHSNVMSSLNSIFNSSQGISMLTETGLPERVSFFQSIFHRLNEKILPKLLQENDAQRTIRDLFPNKYDYKWLSQISDKTWDELNTLFQIVDQFKRPEVQSAIVQSMMLISHKIASLGLEESVARKLQDLDHFESPFVQQNNFLILAVGENYNDGSFSIEHFEKFLYLLNDCDEVLQELHTRRQEIGTSTSLVFTTQALKKYVKRLNLLISLIYPQSSQEFNQASKILFKDIVESENTRTNLFKHTHDYLETLFFEVVEHAASRGGKYIANNVKEYFQYFRAAALGGVFISIFAILKVLSSKGDMSPLGEGLVFSFLYALCFILVYLAGGIIATKQPAMTASAIARCMDQDDNGRADNIQGLKDLIQRVSQSQSIALIGNLVLALPFALIISWLFFRFTSSSLISIEKSQLLLNEVHPTESLSILYAGIAGIFLSLAGLISGYVDNKVIFNRMSERIKSHPLLNRLFPHKRERIARYLGKHLGAIAGNAALGLFLGMAGTIGFFIGIPFDIRHVAFSSANVGMSYGATGLMIESGILLQALIGVLVIGCVNFLVSFSITLAIAMKSRKVTFNQTRSLGSKLFWSFIKNPFDFLIPPELWKQIIPRNKVKSIFQTVKNKLV